MGHHERPRRQPWFTEFYANHISKVTTDGSFTQYTIPTAESRPANITTGADGALWFTELHGNKIGRVTVDGLFAEYTLPTADSSPFDIVLGPYGNLWFTEIEGNKIGRLTPAGVLTEYAIPTAGSGPHGIARGPNDEIWFLERYAQKVVDVGGIVATPTPTPTATATPTATSTPSASCGSEPDDGCRKPGKPLRSVIVLKDRLPDVQDAVVWQWNTAPPRRRLISETRRPARTIRCACTIAPAALPP